MVSEPTVTALATELPDSMPNSAEPNTLTLAGPPTWRPAIAEATSRNSWPRPMRVAITPNSTKWKT